MRKILLLFILSAVCFGQFSGQWKRSGTTISPKNAGDNVAIGTTLLSPTAGVTAPTVSASTVLGTDLHLSGVLSTVSANGIRRPVPESGATAVAPPRRAQGPTMWQADYIVMGLDVNGDPLGVPVAGGVYRWNGTAWVNLNVSVTNIQSIRRFGGIVYIGTSTGQLWRSADNLATAPTQVIAMTDTALKLLYDWAMDQAADGTLYVVGYKNSPHPATTAELDIWKSTNNGATFSIVSDLSGTDLTGANTHIHRVKCHPTNPQIVYLSQGDGSATTPANIWKSTNGGVSWTSILRSGGPSSPRKAIMAQPTAAVMVDANTILWGSDDGQASYLLRHDLRTDAFTQLRTFDGAKDPALATKPYGMLAHNGVLYMAGGETENSMYTSYDYGDSWHQIWINAAGPVWTHMNGPARDGYLYFGSSGSGGNRGTVRIRPLTPQWLAAKKISRAYTNICVDPYGFTTGWTIVSPKISASPLTDPAFMGDVYATVADGSVIDTRYLSPVGSVSTGVRYRYVVAVKEHTPHNLIGAAAVQLRLRYYQADGTSQITIADYTWKTDWALTDQWKLLWVDDTAPAGAVSRVRVEVFMGGSGGLPQPNLLRWGYLGIYQAPDSTPEPETVAAAPASYTGITLPQYATVYGIAQKEAFGYGTAGTYTLWESGDAATPTNWYKLYILNGQIRLDDQGGNLLTTTTGLPAQRNFEHRDTIYWALQWYTDGAPKVRLYIATQRSATEAVTGAAEAMATGQSYVWLGADHASANQADAKVFGWQVVPDGTLTQAQIEALWSTPDLRAPR
jgi:hypothetical protein